MRHEERTGKLDYISEEKFQTKVGDRRMENTRSVRDIWNTENRCHIHVIIVLVREKETGEETVSAGKVGENFPVRNKSSHKFGKHSL